VRVTPTPGSDLRALTFVGGRSPRAARRAARFGLPFFPDSGDPALREEYARSCREHGREPGLVITPERQVHYLFVSEDPEGYWERIGPHLLHEALTYGSWQPAGSRSSAATDATTLEELRAGDLFTILPPDEAVRWASGRPVLLLYPLCGGIPPEVAWESLHLVEHEVLPHLHDSRSTRRAAAT
jgi:alkanesulfonate monooxygenase SsuD/methylene tetrahydromethanopterin reductase-like flavin-dependent oxidoreductase (luciferase family)